jgi:hypothetical protein
MVSKLLKLGVVSRVQYSPSLVVNPIFVVENHDGLYRLILNSSVVNDECVSYHHFKMETLSEVLSHVNKGDFMASLDLVKGFYNIPLHADHRQYFAFKWHGQFYWFLALPMGLKEAPRLFTVILKALLKVARERGYSIFAYIDDTFLRGLSYQETLRAIQFFARLLQSAGFLLHPDKSVFVPSTRIKFLGFIVDSMTMTVELPVDKQVKLFREVRQLRSAVIKGVPVKIRKLAKVLGFLISCTFATKYGLAHYRTLEWEKQRLLTSYGSWEEKVVISTCIVEDLDWWLSLSTPIFRYFEPQRVSHVITTDASTSSGWGAICGSQRVAGVWPPQESFAIGLLELRATVRASQHLQFDWENANVHFRIDNQVALSCVNKLGGRNEELNAEARVLWRILESNNAFAHATYIPTADNPADSLSRIMTRSKASLLDTE